MHPNRIVGNFPSGCGEALAVVEFVIHHLLLPIPGYERRYIQENGKGSPNIRRARFQPWFRYCLFFRLRLSWIQGRIVFDNFPPTHVVLPRESPLPVNHGLNASQASAVNFALAAEGNAASRELKANLKMLPSSTDLPVPGRRPLSFSLYLLRVREL